MKRSNSRAIFAWTRLLRLTLLVAIFAFAVAPVFAQPTGADAGSTPTLASEAGDEATTWIETIHLPDLLKWCAAIVVFIFLGYWAGQIIASFARRRKYQDIQADEHLSVDERLLSELAPMEVALLRGSIEGYYEKVNSVMYQVLKSRKLVPDSGAPLKTEDFLERLRAQGVEPTFLDCVESIARRCDAARFDGHRPTPDANVSMIRDLDTLIRMRPKPTGRRRDRKPDIDIAPKDIAPKDSVKRNRGILQREDSASEQPDDADK